MKKIAIISYGGLPLPPVNGGAVENLIHFWVCNNENNQIADLTVYSTANEQAYKRSKDYRATKFVYVKRREILERITHFTNRVVRKLHMHDAFLIYPYLIDVAKQIRKIDYDYIILENRPEFVPYLCKNSSSRIILHMHNDYFNEKFFCATKIAPKCSKIIAVSDYVKRCIETINCDNDKVCVLRNVVDARQMGGANSSIRETIRNEYNIRESDVVYAFFGRTIPGKGIKELIKAFSILASKRDDVKLLIVGAPWFGENMESKFLRELKSLSAGIEDRIIFTGYVDYERIFTQYACADVVVVPSIMGEACGLVVLEAMAAGKPLIVSDSGGIPEHVDPDCAVVIPRSEGFVTALVDAMDKLASSESKRESMGRHSAERALQYDSENYLCNFLALLDN